MIADGAGRAIAFRIAPGQAHELPQAIPLLDLCDANYDCRLTTIGMAGST